MVGWGKRTKLRMPPSLNPPNPPTPLSFCFSLRGAGCSGQPDPRARSPGAPIAARARRGAAPMRRGSEGAEVGRAARRSCRTAPSARGTRGDGAAVSERAMPPMFTSRLKAACAAHFIVRRQKTAVYLYRMGRTGPIFLCAPRFLHSPSRLKSRAPSPDLGDKGRGRS